MNNEAAASWQTTWAREADKVKELAENNGHLRSALVKAEEECATWRIRAEEAEEVVGTLQLHNERLREALDILNDIINSAMRAAESRAYKANDVYEEAVFARVPPFADTANTPAEESVVSDKSTDNLHTLATPEGGE